jgi:hypothetical protein
MEVIGKYMVKKSFSARIDEDIYGAIDAHCKEEGISQAQWLERMARTFLTGGSVLADPIDSKIEAAINPLRDELAELREALGKSQAA